ncbi:MAG: UDP-N-acetylmuramoyl-L-alanyl-D-glutamate--2,6-diaminopimelate ligase [Candidatus Omnitrophota bacterium]
MKLEKVLDGLSVEIDPRLAETDISCISADSRHVKKGCLFIAVEGLRFDGHKFVNEALEKGALAAVVDRKKRMSQSETRIIRVRDTREALSVAAKNFYRSPSERLKVIGITGTNGKTTTSLLIESIFKEALIPCGVIGTIEYRTGRRSVRAPLTTPGALGTNALLDKMLKNGLRAVVMEVSSHALDQKRASDIYFDAAVFTNLTHEHLDYHGTLRRYFASKIKIFENLKKSGTAIINADERYTGLCVKKIKNRRIITYGLSKNADISARVEKVHPLGSSFTVRIRKKKSISIRTKLAGLHNVSNILAAVSAAISQGISANAVKRGIEKVKNVPGRLEPVGSARAFKVFIDYAHTHNALEVVLKFLNRIKSGKVITVFGCGGERDRRKRPLMGGVAQKFSDFVVITGDNPRNENPARITREIVKGMNRKKRNYCIIPDRKKAIEKALKKAGEGDIVLIAGKGHEKVQVIGNREIPFDDKKVARKILQKSK